ncbi:branched-chain amino acid aminotransferase [Rhodomicrobium udaipurense JA643]|uniref:Branched-chain-amino-acid aminotransferase n=1 Tax=Rhodomicrobium udaipurense TaxID=1202716 RepID=A0A8I1GCE3_9HYPH|nr:branched-chain amino acid aminotransferase [Rhodomicrobium udaipurense]KAI96378.1 branched-chain amino acid aminotransferase [Rhodomicrobium udaipurense JA643]MBJ7544502.1 branched-chain amino acid aminotransferase [Rhodomicrobium udaipurense]
MAGPAPIPYDQRDGFIWMDGGLVPWRDAKVHVLTHALHYGSGVFEGARIYEGEVFASLRHAERLRASAEILGFEVPYSAEQLDQAFRDVIKAQKLDEGYIRPVAWRGPEEMGVAAKHSKIHVAVAVWDWGSYFPMEERLKGIRLCFAKYRRPDPATAPSTAKAAGLYMICTIEKHRSMDLGYNDALMLDWRGYVAEATGANIFFVKDGQIHTPDADCFLNGITRQTLIAQAKARGITVHERRIQPEEMAGFEQCFLTGSAAEVTPVSEIGEYRFTVGEITKSLMAEYSALARPSTRPDKLRHLAA